MTRHRDQLSDSFAPDGAGRLLAKETGVTRRILWRLAGWGFAAIAAVTLAALANHSFAGLRREQAASADILLQIQQTQSAARESLADTKRLAAAVDTLNSDRDRMYARLSVLEQSLDSVTGSIRRQAVAAPDNPIDPPNAGARADAGPLIPAPPAPIAPTPPTAVAASAANIPSGPEIAVAKTAFGVDLGASVTIDRLRALWRREAANHPALAVLQPIVVVRERGGAPGFALHLVAGPVGDAAAAARLCASLAQPDRNCEPAIYDGQRLALGPAAPLPIPIAPPAAVAGALAPAGVPRPKLTPPVNRNVGPPRPRPAPGPVPGLQ